MSHPDDITTKKKSRAGASMMVWVLMGMLVAGLGGFGVTNFGRSVTAVGSVGSQEIDVNQYARALKTQVNQLSQQFGQQLSLKDAKIFGIDQQVLQSLISNAALDNESQRIGLSVGNVTVAQKVAAVQSFQDVTGKFSRDTYAQVLQQNSISIKEFESGIRQDTARQLLQAAIVGGFVAPAALTDTVYAYTAETRDFSVLHLTEGGLPAKLPVPTDADLKTYYDAHLATFTRAESKHITYAALMPADLAPTMKVDEAAVQKLYDSRADQYVVPEKRLVERLVFPSDADAAAAKAKIDAGATFETVVKERGLELTDIDLGDVTKAQLGQAGDAVFALTAPGIVGPLPSDLGPALFRMNGILASSETKLADVHDKLALEVQTTAAQKAISDKVEAADDLLAGGATLEDLAKDQSMKLATFDYAKDADDNDPIAADPAFTAAADKLAQGDFPELITLGDGGVVAMRMDATVPPTPIPLDKAHAKLVAAWRADALAAALKAQGEAAQTAIAAGATLGAQGVVDIFRAVTRDATPEDIPADAVKAVFDMKPGELRLVDLPGYTALVHLDAITPADTTSDAAKAARDKLAKQVQQTIAQDAYGLYTDAMTAQGGLTIDQSVIDSVQSRMN
ncbi:MAG: peptidyl-prolyl cis-trans isomerase [Paracoccaceae bacterium]